MTRGDTPMNTRIDPATVQALAQDRYASPPSHDTCRAIADMISRMQACLDGMEPAPSWQGEPADLYRILETADGEPT